MQNFALYLLEISTGWTFTALWWLPFHRTDR